jgi:hypothetical protein
MAKAENLPIFLGPLDERRDETDLGGKLLKGLSLKVLKTVGGTELRRDGKVYLQLPLKNLAWSSTEADWDDTDSRNPLATPGKEVFISYSYDSLPDHPGRIFLFTIVIPKGGGKSYWMAGTES